MPREHPPPLFALQHFQAQPASRHFPVAYLVDSCVANPPATAGLRTGQRSLKSGRLSAKLATESHKFGNDNIALFLSCSSRLEVTVWPQLLASYFNALSQLVGGLACACFICGNQKKKKRKRKLV